jgi:hypothetical protein
LKTYTRQHRDAPVSTRDLIVSERKAGRWPRALELVKAEARRLGVVTEQPGRVALDVKPLPLWLVDELATICMGAECWEDAQSVLVLLAKALEQIPGEQRNEAMTWRKLGQCCEVLGDYSAALLAYQKGIALVRSGVTWDDDSRLWVHYGSNLFRAGRVSEGEDAWRTSLTRQCTSTEAKYTRAQIRMALGDWETGWSEYESRKELHGYFGAVRARYQGVFPPAWDGVSKQRVLVVMGQGAGDAIMFARYLPMVEQVTGYAPVFLPGDPLETFLGYGGSPEQAVHAHADSLPFLLRRPEPIPPHCTDPWRRPEVIRPKPRVGVCWKGSPKHLNDKDRSSPIDPRGILQDERWELVSVQNGHDFAPKDYAETAELMRTLDAVVTVDTSVAHVAGTIGVPTVMIPPSAREWRWGIRGETTPWYPSMTLIHRKSVWEWEEAWGRTKKLLAETLR